MLKRMATSMPKEPCGLSVEPLGVTRAGRSQPAPKEGNFCPISGQVSGSEANGPDALCRKLYGCGSALVRCATAFPGMVPEELRPELETSHFHQLGPIPARLREKRRPVRSLRACALHSRLGSLGGPLLSLPCGRRYHDLGFPLSRFGAINESNQGQTESWRFADGGELSGLGIASLTARYNPDGSP